MAELYALETQISDQADPKPGAPAAGFGLYASYHALWHLREIGVVRDLRTFESPGWSAAEGCREDARRPTRVALIDVSVAYAHPNLEHAVLSGLMIDFFSRRLGTFPRPDVENDLLTAAIATAPGKADILSDKRVRELFAELCDNLPGEYTAARGSDWRAPLRVAPATHPSFSAHGTAMAGLIGARPRGADEVCALATRHIGGGDRQPRPAPADAVGFPYAGVDPFCHIIPISTSFDPDPEQLVLALLYAWLVDADVIVLARDFADPRRTLIERPGVAPDRALDAYPVKFADDEIALWDALRQLTVDLSRKVAIVCAAGNGGDEPMMYPASLARDDNGIVAVGARAATGQRAGYSSIGAEDAGAVTIYAPSGDGERLDKDIQRLDTANTNFRSQDHSAWYVAQLGVQHAALPSMRASEPSVSTFATQEIITTDVPGPAGYNSSAFGRASAGDGDILDYRSYYCRFSGTSAACALVAGALSLAMSAEKIDPRDPLAAKRRLRGGSAATDDAAGLPSLSWDALTGT